MKTIIAILCLLLSSTAHAWNSARLQAAINSLPDSGGTITVPSGTHILSSMVVLDKPVVLSGEPGAVLATTATLFRAEASDVNFEGITFLCTAPKIGRAHV